jgi:hypothetical protein
VRESRATGLCPDIASRDSAAAPLAHSAWSALAPRSPACEQLVRRLTANNAREIFRSLRARISSCGVIFEISRVDLGQRSLPKWCTHPTILFFPQFDSTPVWFRIRRLRIIILADYNAESVSHSARAPKRASRGPQAGPASAATLVSASAMTQLGAATITAPLPFQGCRARGSKMLPSG